MKSDRSECAVLFTSCESLGNANEPAVAGSTRAAWVRRVGWGAQRQRGVGTLLELTDTFDLLMVVMVQRGYTHQNLPSWTLPMCAVHCVSNTSVFKVTNTRMEKKGGRVGWEVPW